MQPSSYKAQEFARQTDSTYKTVTRQKRFWHDQPKWHPGQRYKPAPRMERYEAFKENRF